MKKAHLHFQTYYATRGRERSRQGYSLDGQTWKKFFTLDNKTIEDGIDNHKKNNNFWYLEVRPKKP